MAGLTDDFNKGVEWIRQSLDFRKQRMVSFFETTIRCLGGLVTAYELSGDAVLLEKATDLGGLERAAAAMQADPGFAQPYRVPMALEPAPDLLREAVSNPVNAWRPIPPHVRVHLQRQVVQPPAKRPFAQLSEASPGELELEERGQARAAEAEGGAENNATADEGGRETSKS